MMAAECEAAPAPARLAAMSKGRILVVDDSRAQAERVGNVLAREGYDVSFAPDGAAALRRVLAAPPDVLLLDLVLPDQSGIEVLRKVKRLPGVFFPVIIFSAQDDLKARVNGLKNGAEDYVSKEADEAELLARVGAMMRIKDLQDRLRGVNDRLERLSVTDGLTELFNHRHFQTRLREEFGRAQRYGDPLSLLMIDLDRFKAVNDRWLHTFGDKVLREVAVLIRNSVRDHDVSARYGGEEFAVILPKTHLANALHVARRIACAIAGHRFVVDGVRDTATDLPQEIGVTCSCGVASFPGIDVTTPELLVKRADEALFRAKDAGRNRVWAFQGQFYEDAPIATH
jgi:two-component system, cell cycle response regulator